MSDAKKTTATEDQDFDRIMGEIESLQKGMAENVMPIAPASAGPAPVQEDEPVEAPVEEQVLEEFRAASEDASLEETLMDQTLSELKTVTGDAGFAIEAQEPEETPVMASPRKLFQATTAEEATAGALTMTLSGSMKLNLKYEFEGQEVTVGFSDGCLQVQLSDGTEFKVPVNRRGAQKKAAA